MSSKQEAQNRITAASKQSERVLATWSEASKCLSGPVLTNGYGIIQERGEPMRQQLLEAKQKIDQALSELAAVEWPTNRDYDQV